MKWVKSIGCVIFALLAIERVPDIFIITLGLIEGNVDDPSYFQLKLIAYIGMATVYTIASILLFQSVRKGKT